DEEAAALVHLSSLAPDADDALTTRRSLEVLARKLPADELEVALLFRLDRLSQAEIAEVTRVSERTVRRALRRLDARVARMRKELLPCVSIPRRCSWTRWPLASSL